MQLIERSLHRVSGYDAGATRGGPACPRSSTALLARRANIARGLLRSTDQPRVPLSLGGEILEQLPLRAVVARRPFHGRRPLHGRRTAAVDSATPVPSLRRDGGQVPSVTPPTWVDGRGSASLRGADRRRTSLPARSG